MLLLAEEKGKKEKKGMHSAKEPPVQHVNDLSRPGSANKWAPAPSPLAAAFAGESAVDIAAAQYTRPGRLEVHPSM